ncbi:hypothetical protein BVRB_7g177240 isoform B [Beta vulgaris subsp. vulgaris]|nr:hypothetical protein BVRB_7g177240 isoform B [Beta vulgaris subsp. vulgaris]
MWLQSFTILPLILFLFFLYKWLHTQSTPKKILPPSPTRMPVIGNLHQLGTHPHRGLQSLSDQYGELMLIHLGSAPTLIVSSAKAAHEIMKTHDIAFSNRPITKTGNKLLYNGKDVAGAQYGEYWRQMKSICVLQLLSNTRVRSFRSVREEEIALMVEKIEESSSSVVNLSEMFITLTNKVICRVAFGRTYSGNEGGVNFKELLKEFLKLLGNFRVGDFVPWLAWINWLDGSDAEVDKVAKEFDHFLEQVVKEHEDGRGKSRKGGEGEKDESVKNLVDVLLDVQKEMTAGFTIERDSIKAIIVGRQDGSILDLCLCDSLDMSECIGLTKHRKIPLLAVPTPVIGGS